TGAVTDVIAYQVGHYSGISRVILRDAGFHFTNQISTDICRFGEDTAAHAHEQRQQRSTETETEQSIGGRNAENHKYDRSTEQAEAIRNHTGDGTGAIGDP